MHRFRFHPLLPIVLLMAAIALPVDGRTAGSPDPGAIAERFRSGVAALASDEMEGRGLTTEGIRRAADWIEGQLKSLGLAPAFDGKYRQRFDVKTGVTLAQGNRLDGVAEGDWTPLGFSSSGEFDGELAFAGYGIEAPSIGYTELEGLDLTGKVVLMLRYEPQERDDASPFDGRRPSRWSAMRYKAMQARERGAAAVVFVTGPLQDEETDKLPVLKNDGPESPAGIPALQVKTSVADRWLADAGIQLSDFQTAVDRDLVPRSNGATGLRVSGRVALDVTWTPAENLAGLIPGKGPLADEYVVVGAHYDHLGYGGEGSMTPNVTAIHNGADDNASGTVAALLIGALLKDRLAAADAHRAVVIALFSGEESGLAGSSRFVESPPHPIDRNTAMINLDMVGRLRDDTLIALGSDSAPEWAGRIEEAAGAVEGLTVTSHGDGYGPSDQTSFYAAGVPVLHLFTGSHDVYHTPDDDPPTVDAAGGARVALFGAEIAAGLVRDPVRLTYARSSSGPAMSGDSRGYGAYLGTVPDYSAMQATEGGVLLSDVRTGGPADLAGIRGRDRIVAMAGTRIENLYDMTFALQDHRPGDTIEVVVIRDDQRLAMKATLGDRAAMARTAQAASAHGAPLAQAAAAHAPPAGEGKPAHAAPASPHTAPGATKDSAAGHAAPPGAAHAAPGRAGHGSPPAGGHGAPDSGEEIPAIDPFYEGRPGPDFVIGAGKPFDRRFEGEGRLADVRQLTFGGENAEAYFSPDGRHLILQITPREGECDQQYTLDLAGGALKRVSPGTGRTTCGYYDWPEQDRIVYASTMGADETCPAPPDHSQGYVWALYDTYDLWEAGTDGSNPRRLTDSPGYDAEATWCHRGGKILFTSVRDGDLDLYVMEEDGHVTRLTDAPGYDGGAFYSPDCSEIVWRASRPEGKELEDYRRLLAQGLIRPSKLEIFLMDADGKNVRQVTDNGAANFCPNFTADGRGIIYASNAGPAGPREFDLWLIDKAGQNQERITFAPGFDGFPQFSPDGRYLVWASNRANPEARETNIFIARWLDPPGAP